MHFAIQFGVIGDSQFTSQVQNQLEAVNDKTLIILLKIDCRQMAVCMLCLNFLQSVTDDIDWIMNNIGFSTSIRNPLLTKFYRQE